MGGAFGVNADIVRRRRFDIWQSYLQRLVMRGYAKTAELLPAMVGNSDSRHNHNILSVIHSWVPLVVLSVCVCV